MSARRLITPRLLLVLLLALVVRVAAIGVAHQRHVGPVIGDAITYHSLASHLAAGDGYLDQGRYDNPHPPLYPFLLSLVYRVTGPNPLVGAGLQVVFDLLGTLALAWVTLLLTGAVASAELAALLYALWPVAIFLNVMLYTEPLFTLLLVLAVGAGMRMESRASVTWGIATGLLLGLTALTRQTTLYFLIPYLAIAHLARRGRPPGILKARIAAALVFVLALVPWSAREQAVNGRVTWIQDYSGHNLWIGNHVPFSGRPLDRPVLNRVYRELGPAAADDQVVNRALAQLAVREMKADPAGTAILWVKKFWRFMFVDPVGGYPWVRVALTLFLAAIYVLAWRGAFALPPGSGPALGFLLGMFVYFAGVHTATLVHIRLAEPARPLAFALAAHGLTTWWARRAKSAG